MTRLPRAMTPLLSAFAVCALTAHAAPPTYTFQPIQQIHPELLAPVPGVMNNNGFILGYAYSAINFHHNLALWNGTALANAGEVPYDYLGLIDVNDAGQVLGYTVDEDRGIHGFIYQNGVYRNIPNFQYGPGINASGKVPYWNSDMASYFLWNNGNSTTLPMTATVQGTQYELSEPCAINDHDEIAYVSYAAIYSVPSLYVHGANPFVISLPEQFLNATIIGMNNNRQIVGKFITGTEQHKPFLYTDNGTRGSGTFQIFNPDYDLRWLNQRGEILAQKDSDGEYAIFHDYAWYNLSACIPTGWTIGCVYDLNDKGEMAAIVGNESETQLVILKPNGSQNSNTLSGQVSLPNPNGRTVRVTVTGAATQTTTAILDAQGRFTLPITVTGTAAIRLKASNTLAFKVTMTLANGENTLPSMIALRGGDANDDNAVDVTYLLAVINHYNKTQGSSGYLEACDFNLDGKNDVTDLLAVIGNYNKVGD